MDEYPWNPTRGLNESFIFNKIITLGLAEMDEIKDLLKTKRFLGEVTMTVLAVIRHRCPSLSNVEAEDVTQEVLLKIVKSMERGTKIENLRSYIWRVAYTTALDILEEKADEVASAVEIEAREVEKIKDSWRLGASLTQRELRQHLERMLQALSADRRRILKLFLLGMNAKEIADHLEWTHSKVRHLYYRGLRDLRRIIDLRMPKTVMEDHEGTPDRFEQRELSRKRRIRPVLSE
jgi:RNA polymerase sigma factor (sigma-70 family)